MILELNHLTLAVRNLETSCRFYRELLGFQWVAHWPRGAYLESGRLWLALTLDPSRSPSPSADDTHVAFTVSARDFSIVAERLRQGGVEEWRENRSEGPSLYLLDPDGHKLELHVGDLGSRLADLAERNDPAVELFARAPSAVRARHQEFRSHPLRQKDLVEDPLAQCRAWLEEAVEAGELDPYAMTLATVAADGGPSSRTVSLKAIEGRGFLFTSPYHGPKAQELAADRRASLVLYWPAMQRQVRALGTVERLEREASERYFRDRPRASQLALWVFPPSEPIPDRRTLEARFAALEDTHRGAAVPMPEWGGFLVRPSKVELWQGDYGRLHDRFRYQRLEDGSWRLQRLAP